MELKDYEELKSYLEKDYILTKKRWIWSSLGGALAFIIATGYVSFEAGRQAINNDAVQKAIEDIKVKQLEAERLVEGIKKRSLNFPEIQLPTVIGTGISGWKEILKLRPQSAVRIEAFTSENNYIQPWVIYAWRAYAEQPAGKYIMPIPDQHGHSSAVEWEMLSNGTLQAKATKYNTPRILKITELNLLRGDVDIYIK